MYYQADRAWANTSKGIRQCQKADKALDKGNVDSAAKHFNKALDYFSTAVDHMAKAEDDANAKAGKLIDAGDDDLQTAVDMYVDGDLDGAEKYYEKALDKYDEALDLFD